MDLNPAAWDLNREAREALQAAVANYGPAVLSNARMLNNFFKDVLPDSPREGIALVAAAEADVAGMLRERLGQQLDPDSALRLTAADLSSRRAIDPAAGLWAAGEFARVLGYLATDPIPEDAPSAGLGSEARTEPAGADTQGRPPPVVLPSDPSPDAIPVPASTVTATAGATHNSRRIALVGFVLVALLAGGIATAVSLAGGRSPHQLARVSTSQGLTDTHNGHNISLSSSPSTTSPSTAAPTTASPTTSPSTTSPPTTARSPTAPSTTARTTAAVTTAPVRSVPATSPSTAARSPASPPPGTTPPATVPPSVAPRPAVPTVPRVVGLSLAAATARLEAKGYFNIPYIYSCLGSQNHGFVVTQAPGGGSQAATGTAIRLQLEAENCRLVPNVRDLTLAGAAGLLKSAGFDNIPYVYKCLGSDLLGEVQSQSPGPGADIVATDPVHLVLQAYGCAGGARGRDGDDASTGSGS